MQIENTLDPNMLLQIKSCKYLHMERFRRTPFQIFRFGLQFFTLYLYQTRYARNSNNIMRKAPKKNYWISRELFFYGNRKFKTLPEL